MKALSVRPPWAELLVSGKKPVEYRKWRSRYRGPLLIHESRSNGGRGAIIGRVEMVDCVRSQGIYGFVMKNARPITPIPYPGELMIFEVSLPSEALDEALQKG
jgi:hypothetical protein